MAYTLLTGESIQFPRDFGGVSLSPAFSSAGLIDATGEKFAVSGAVWWPSRTGTKSIRKIHFRFGAVTKAGGSGLTVSLQNVLTASGSGPLPDETQDEYINIANGDAGFTSNVWYPSGNLSADRSVSLGELVSVVWEYDGGGRLGSDSVVIAGLAMTSSEAKSAWPNSALKTGGSWSSTTLPAPNVIFEFSDGTFGKFFGAFSPTSALNTHSYKSDTAGADEYALKWTPAFNCKCDGAFIRVNSGVASDFDVVLYDGTTALKTYSVDANTVAGLPTRSQFLPWSEVTLSAGGSYRLALKPTTTSPVTVYSTDVNDVNHMVLLPGGSEMCHSTRVDGGSWSDTSTRRLLGFGFSISSIDDGASSGGGARMVNTRGGADQ